MSMLMFIVLYTEKYIVNGYHQQSDVGIHIIIQTAKVYYTFLHWEFIFMEQRKFVI